MSAVFMVIVSGGLVLVTMVFLVGMAGDPQRMVEDAGPVGLVVMAVIVVAASVLIVAWWLGLKGHRVALALLVPAGLGRALLMATTHLRRSPGSIAARTSSSCRS